MKICRTRFNFYLALLAAFALTCGCKSTEESKRKKALSTFRVHVETNPEPMGRTEQITVGRDNPVKLTIFKAPFIGEEHVKSAKIVDVIGGFILQVNFDQEGTMILEQYTAANTGRHLAAFSQWPQPPEEKLNGGRWLAAPKINNHISDGVLSFTPDATREEADQFVLGLNHVAEKLQTGKEVKW